MERYESNFEKTVFISAHSAGLCSGNINRCIASDASDFNGKRRIRCVFGCPLHFGLRCLCNRADHAGYRYILVAVRTNNNSSADSGWWTWGCDSSFRNCTDRQTKNQSSSEKHHAGSHFRTAGRRCCKVYELYFQNNISD